MPVEEFRIDLNETFPKLSRAPIVEAVVHWQARPQRPFDLDALRSNLATQLPQFPTCEPIQRIEFHALVAGQADADPQVRKQQAWDGFRLTSEDGTHIAQFLRDGLVVSRTQPYEHWEPFVTAAKCVWQVFRKEGAPQEIQRLGVRFINHLASATFEHLGDFLAEPPTRPSNLPLKEFMYQSTFSVPDHNFGVRVVKVMQPPSVPQSSGLFLDCDVFTTKPLESEVEMEEALIKMRWLKNKIFFSLLTPAAIRAFQ